jgi:hypothetical protein
MFFLFWISKIFSQTTLLMEPLYDRNDLKPGEPLVSVWSICMFWKKCITHLMVWVLLIVEDPTVTVNCTAIKVLFLYFNLCLSVILDSLSCSFTSISFLTNCSFINPITKNNTKQEKQSCFLLLMYNYQFRHTITQNT